MKAAVSGIIERVRGRSASRAQAAAAALGAAALVYRVLRSGSDDAGSSEAGAGDATQT